ncbi:periplasmic binding protein-like I [Chlamydoabsidia padenii]|nr:periplasmic binding protein-like I [Chlamydoabsidia padenii]
MIEEGINAVIGDMVSNISEVSAGLTGLFQIPQCSCGASSLALSDKDNYPYFFRTMGNVVVYGKALMEWIRQMNWTMFALVYTDDTVGQQILSSMLTKSYQYGITPMSQIPLYDLHPEEITNALQALITSGSRVVVVADSNPVNQILILQAARSMGMLSEGWVWMLTNDLSEALSESVDTQDLVEFDGLMFITGLWNLTSVPAYNNLYGLWQQQVIPPGFVDASQWNTMGLSYNGPNAYSCAEVLALGLNKALDEYPGGRLKGLADLSSKTFNSTRMTPTFYNMNYTGPAGLMSFTESGDQETGHFGLLYMQNGSTVNYAELDNGVYKPIPDVPILYLGNTHQWPADMAIRSELNPKSTQAAGLIIYVLACTGMVLCGLTMVLIICYRNLKMVLISSPIFLCLQLAGIFFSYMSVILYMGNVTVAKCVTRQLSLLVGFILVIGSIIAKSYRIYQIFQNIYTLQASKLQSVYLLRIVLLFGIVTVAPLVVWFAIYPIEPTSYMVNMNSYCILCAYPTSNKHVDWIHLNIAELVCALICFTLILTASLLAWKTRKVSSKWSESQQIGYVSYTTGLGAIVAAPTFFLSIDLYQVAIYLKLAAILFCATFTFFVLFLTKLIFIGKYMTSQNWWKKYSRRHHKQYDDDRMGSCSELIGAPYQFEKPSDIDNANRTILDLTVKAHEGILPVKKKARFHYMSIWQLKHIVVIPSGRTFMLKTTIGHKAEYHRYVSCQKVKRDNSDGHLFCVWTDADIQFYFQVHNEKALKKWMDWFNDETQPDDINADNGQQQVDLHNRRQNNNLPSTSTLGATSGSPLKTMSTTNQTGTMASSDRFLDSFAAPRQGIYQHQYDQHNHNFTPSVTSDNTADIMDTYNFYGAPHHKIDSNHIITFGGVSQHKIDSNPITTFGVNNDGSTGHSY